MTGVQAAQRAAWPQKFTELRQPAVVPLIEEHAPEGVELPAATMAIDQTKIARPGQARPELSPAHPACGLFSAS